MSNLSGFFLEKKLLGFTGPSVEPKYLNYPDAMKMAYSLDNTNGGELIEAINFYWSSAKFKYHESLDWHHGIDLVVILPQGVITIDVSTYKKIHHKAMVNITPGPWGLWRQQIEAALHK